MALPFNGGVLMRNQRKCFGNRRTNFTIRVNLNLFFSISNDFRLCFLMIRIIGNLLQSNFCKKDIAIAALYNFERVN